MKICLHVDERPTCGEAETWKNNSVFHEIFQNKSTLSVCIAAAPPLRSAVVTIPFTLTYTQRTLCIMGLGGGGGG